MSLVEPCFKQMYYVYLILCKNSSLYIGVTNNVGRRFIEHTSGLHEDSYTSSRRPLKLVFCKQFNSPLKAIRYEKQLKGWARARKIALLYNDFNLLHELAKCKNETTHEKMMSRSERSRTMTY